MEATTPRITSSLLSKYRNQNVRCVGRILHATKTVATLETCDRGQVTVHLGPDTTLMPLSNVEVMGRVSDDLTIQEIATYIISDNFDFDFYNAVVEITQKYPNLFF